MLVLAKIVSVDVDVPFGVNETGFMLKVVDSPGYETCPARDRIQQKPFRLTIVMDVVADEPSWTVMLPGFALTEKSYTLISTVAECVSEPLVPVTTTK